MAETFSAKRKAEESKLKPRPNKKFKKQTYYSSGSSDSDDPGPSLTAPAVEVLTDKEAENDDSPFTAGNSDGENDASNASNASAFDSDADSSLTSDTSAPDTRTPSGHKRTKRHDPSAFASAISAILDSKAGKTDDPILARSKAAAEAAHSHAEARLEVRARRKLRDDRRIAADKGRIRDVLLGDRRQTPVLSESEVEESNAGKSVRAADRLGKEKVRGSRASNGTTSVQSMSAAEIAEKERSLRKTAQRGVVKLFNAVRSAQVKAEEAASEVKQKGMIGTKRREETVGEMGKQAFLDLVSTGKADTQ